MKAKIYVVICKILLPLSLLGIIYLNQTDVTCGIAFVFSG